MDKKTGWRQSKDRISILGCTFPLNEKKIDLNEKKKKRWFVIPFSRLEASSARQKTNHFETQEQQTGKLKHICQVTWINLF